MHTQTQSKILSLTIVGLESVIARKTVFFGGICQFFRKVDIISALEKALPGDFFGCLILSKKRNLVHFNSFLSVITVYGIYSGAKKRTLGQPKVNKLMSKNEFN